MYVLESSPASPSLASGAVAVEAHVGRGLPSLTLAGLYLHEFDAEVDPVLKALSMLGQSRIEFLGLVGVTLVSVAHVAVRRLRYP
jgi:hypothetical protein